MISTVPDVKTLPSLSVYQYTNLPSSQGLYIVVNGDKYVYIGKAQNSMKNRWYAHHRLEELLSIETARIHFLKTRLTLGQLIDLEDQVINQYKPELNFINKKPLDKSNLESLKFRAKKFRLMIALENKLIHETKLAKKDVNPDLVSMGKFLIQQTKVEIEEIRSEFGFHNIPRG